MITTVIFDLDDLLSDTEALHCRAYQRVLGRYGVGLREEQYWEHWIRRGLGVTEYLRSQGANADVETVRREKAAEYAKLVERDCRPMPGALELLERLRGRKRLGLASSAHWNAVGPVLARLGIGGRFGCVVTGDQVARPKPFPDVFLEAARRLGVEARECVVLEDAEKGVIAAKAAGMKCVAVPSGHTAGNDFSGSDLVVESLSVLTLGMLDAM